jgi:hypothetical protein
VSIGHDTDDLAGRLLELRADVFANDHLLADRVLLRPVLFSHGLIDENHARRAGSILVRKVAAAQDGDLEHAEVAGGNAHPPAPRGIFPFDRRTAHDGKR